jgi:TolB-like protein/Tfp pilus assembly protein PilF
MTSLLEHLKERKLVQWALAYLAGAWVVLQVLDFLSDTYGWPAVVLRVAPVIVAVGFSIVLVLAWFHGEKGQQRVTGTELVILAVLLAAGGGALWLVGTRSTGARTGATAQAAEARPGATPAERSIAVLPFENMSANPENEYFSDGITEEILNALAQVPGLKVSARTSAFQFKDKAVDVRDVAEKLGVAHVLEGSVQRSGDRLRIMARLISAKDGYPLWSQRYDRELEDVFAIQDEISRAIVDALKVRLAENNAPLVSAPTRSSEAHDLYLRGRFFWGKRTPQSLRTAAEYFRKATELDPAYAAAYAGLADANFHYSIYGGANPGVDIRAEANKAAQRALALDSSLAEAHAAHANVALWHGDIDKSEGHMRRAIELNPNYASARQWYSYALAWQGRYPEALAEIRKAYELDPLSLVIGRALGVILADAGQLTASVEQLRRTIEIDPSNAVPHAYLAMTYSRMGRHTEAEAEARQARRLDPGNLVVLHIYTITLARAGKRGEAEAALREYEQRAPSVVDFHRNRAEILVSLGDHEQALQALEKHLRDSAGTYPPPGRTWLLEPLRSDPRFQRLSGAGPRQ